MSVLKKIDKWADENYKKLMLTLMTSALGVLVGFVIEWHIDEATEEAQQFDNVEQKIRTVDHAEKAQKKFEKVEKSLEHIEEHLHDTDN